MFSKAALEQLKKGANALAQSAQSAVADVSSVLRVSSTGAAGGLAAAKKKILDSLLNSRAFFSLSPSPTPSLYISF
jgi:glycerate kinase